ncbi:hypothetical protein UB31_08570 [Bradyrhizobium sp. LTSP849]|uniref:hypothetical protein n=1 Tax=Bradyrhizobium sp. LTSP849 TaxID=1615890 RepID=UPI0005D2895A|nr:hypothetical protein [Bradyrhizobium sp. LTSP849]KJC53459.1 hypothetical protein UB31_08570 [Bradyrhizobium sp. LTSP849]
MNMHVDAPVSGGEEPCLFEVGAYARTSDGIVCVIGGSEKGYEVTRTERDEECFYRADELSPWSPLPGDRVVEAGNENCAAGVVIDVDSGTSQVKWPHFNRLLNWDNAHLEPAWSQR